MWAKNIVHACMHISDGERVLVIVDQPLHQVRERLTAEILSIDPLEVWTYVFPEARRPLLEYPPLLHQVAAEHLPCHKAYKTVLRIGLYHVAIQSMKLKKN